jgi:hypothetical protein
MNKDYYQDDHIDIGELQIPVKYFKFTNEDKEAFCNRIIDKLIRIIDRTYPSEFNRITLLNEILNSSIYSNEQDESYEVCEVLKDIQKILNEA